MTHNSFGLLWDTTHILLPQPSLVSPSMSQPSLTSDLSQQENNNEGRKRIKIAHIEDSRSRQVTFLKRKNGLMKKAMELVSCIIFSSTYHFKYFVSTFLVRLDPSANTNCVVHSNICPILRAFCVIVRSS